MPPGKNTGIKKKPDKTLCPCAFDSLRNYAKKDLSLDKSFFNGRGDRI